MVLRWKRFVIGMNHFAPADLTSVYAGPSSAVARAVQFVELVHADVLKVVAVFVKCHLRHAPRMVDEPRWATQSFHNGEQGTKPIRYTLETLNRPSRG